MKKLTLSLLLTLVLLSCQKALVYHADPAGSLAGIAGGVHTQGTSSGFLTANVVYTPGSNNVYVAVQWNGPNLLQNVSIIVTAGTSTLYSGSLGQMTPGATINTQYMSGVPLYNGMVLTLYATGSDGSSAMDTKTVMLSSNPGGGVGGVPGMASSPHITNVQLSGYNGASLYYNVHSVLSWDVITLPPGSPYYNQLIYACIQYTYSNNPPYHYCVTNNVGTVHSANIQSGSLPFEFFINYPVGQPAPACSMPETVGFYWQTTPFLPDTVSARLFTRVPMVF
ncbi:MAG TPA: hypothetical protein VI233_05050 [Puia sp.]